LLECERMNDGCSPPHVKLFFMELLLFYFPSASADNITARWDGLPMPKQANLLDGDDVGTLLTSQMDGAEEEAKAPLSCSQKIVKVIHHLNGVVCHGICHLHIILLCSLFQFIKIMVPHVVLVAVLIGYLCLGASILQALETRTELVARSRKLVRLNNIIENFTAESWHLVEQQREAAAGSGHQPMSRETWAVIFRDYMVSVAQEVDDR
jgi:hypothetical protein